MRWLIIIFILLSGLTAKSQQGIFTNSKTDTIEIRGDSVLVVLRSYEDTVLKEEVTAFLIPDSIRVAIFPRICSSCLRRMQYVTKMVEHNKSIEYLGQVVAVINASVTNLGEVRKISTYRLGHLTSTKYINEKDDLIDPDLIPHDNIRGPCTTSSARYIVTGTRKMKAGR